MSPSASVLAAIALALIGEVFVGALAVQDWRVLRLRGGRRLAYGLAAASVVLAAIGIVAYRFVWVFQPWLDAGLVAPLILVTIFPGRLISLTAGPKGMWHLAVELEKINVRWGEIQLGDQVTQADSLWLVERSRSLDKWRSAESNDLVDLWQAKISDLLSIDDREGYKGRCIVRNARMKDLHQMLFRKFCVGSSGSKARKPDTKPRPPYGRRNTQT